jgi:hypothetical protein
MLPVFAVYQMCVLLLLLLIDRWFMLKSIVADNVQIAKFSRAVPGQQFSVSLPFFTNSGTLNGSITSGGSNCIHFLLDSVSTSSVVVSYDLMYSGFDYKSFKGAAVFTYASNEPLRVLDETNTHIMICPDLYIPGESAFSVAHYKGSVLIPKIPLGDGYRQYVVIVASVDKGLVVGNFNTYLEEETFFQPLK